MKIIGLTPGKLYTVGRVIQVGLEWLRPEESPVLILSFDSYETDTIYYDLWNLMYLDAFGVVNQGLINKGDLHAMDKLEA